MRPVAGEDVSAPRKPVELIALPLAFSQAALLPPTEFVSRAADRGLDLGFGRLEALHKARILVPMFAIDYGPRVTVQERKSAAAMEINPWLKQEPRSGHELGLYFAKGRLVDTAAMPFVPWTTPTMSRGRRYLRYRYLYSAHQLLRIPDLRNVTYRLRRVGEYGIRAVVEAKSRKWTLLSGIHRTDELVVAADALATVYRPYIMGTISVPLGGSTEWYALWDARDPAALLRWIGWSTGQLREAAEHLLRTAHNLDPLRNWHQLVRHASPEVWMTLRGDALVAMDHRIVAELLLRLHEDLSARGLAQPLDPVAGELRYPLVERLGGQHDLDRVLTEFDLSPHPSVVLVVEGRTEQVLLPRVLDLLGSTAWRRVVEVVDGGGADTNLEVLAAFAVRLHLGRTFGDLIELDRPPARLVVVTDPEGKRATWKQRRKLRRAWLKRIYEATDPGRRNPELCRQLVRLIDLVVWDEAGQSFEFANFTDEEITNGIMSLAAFVPPPDRAAVELAVAERRSHPDPKRRNLKYVWHDWPIHPSKVDLANALWPVLSAKILADGSNSSKPQVPARRVAEHVLRSIYRLRRSHVVVRVTPVSTVEPRSGPASTGSADGSGP
jgi:hypothetical protein